MAQRRHHYEKAFEDFLRARKIPYVAVDEARKALLPESASLQTLERDGAGKVIGHALKSFDFVLYGSGVNLLAEIKGRRIPKPRPRANAGDVESSRLGAPRSTRTRRARLENWVTQDDVESLTRWEQLFGSTFEAAFVFVYWCDEQPPDALFEEIFEHRAHWYAIRTITLSDYRSAMKIRSPRWRTVHLPQAAFDRASRPLVGGFRWANSEEAMDAGPETILSPLG
jgi:hypothetical protein